MSKNDQISKRLEAMKKGNENQNASRPANVINAITKGEEDKKDFKKMAEELKKIKEETKNSVLTGYRKDTIYIREDLHDAFNALCVKHGDKKAYANEAIEDFLIKKYKEMHMDK